MRFFSTTSSDPKNETVIKPALTDLKNKRKTVSNLQLSFELFKMKLNDSERNSKDKMTAEDNMNMDLRCILNERAQRTEEPKQVSNDVKLIWLQSALNFIKNDYQVILKFPTISVEEANFIRAILHQDYEPHIDGRFSALYLSLKEALTIYKTKYIFALNPVFKSETVIKLELEKIPKNNKLKLAKIPSNVNDGKIKGKQLKKLTKLINDKMNIMKAVPMYYVIDCYQQILDFLDDDLRCTIIFDKLSKYEFDFLMNIKQIVKSRDILEDGLPDELNEILEQISSHKDYAFSLTPNRSKREGKYVMIMKVPKGGVKNNLYTENCFNTSQTSYNCPGTNDFETQPTELNNNKILYRKIDNTVKNTNESNASNLDHNCTEEKQIGIEFNNNTFKPINYPMENNSSTSDSKETHYNSWENVNISHWQQPAAAAAADPLSAYNEKKLTNQPKSVQFQRGGSVDVINKDPCTNVKTQNSRGRSWSRDRVNQITKMYEALSVPLKSTKAMRMMQLMGWKGGALGSRGEGITEPIMPAIGIQPGAGLGHGSINFVTNVIPKKESPPVPLLLPEQMPNNDKSFQTKKAKKKVQNVVEGEETRLKILSKILEFINSGETKMVLCFDEVLKEEDTRFVICSIERFNRRKYVRNLKSQYGAEDLRKVQEAMLVKPHMNLATVISEDKKDIVLTKQFKNVNNNDIAQDFAVDSDDSIRLNISVFRYIKTMRPKEIYGIYTKPAYQLLGFKLSMLEEILKFLDIKQSTLILHIDISLSNKHIEFLENFIDVINVGRKPRYATEAEELLVDKIYNKIEDYYFILDYIRPLKIIKLQKINQNLQYSEDCETSSDELETKDLKRNDVKEVLLEKQNDDNLNQLNTSIEFNIEKTVEQITTNVMNNLTQMYGRSVNNVSEDNSTIQENTQTHKEAVTADDSLKMNTKDVNDDNNTDIITIDLTEEIDNTGEEEIQNNVTTDDGEEYTVENLVDIIKKEGEDNQQETKEKEVKEQEKEEDLSAESDDILKIIEDLEQSIKVPFNEELNYKRNRSDSNDSQALNTKKIKRHSIKCYKQIQITPNNEIETMNVNLAGIVQSLISNAIDCTDCLPLLQCNGIVDDKLLYVCYNESTYIWLKTVLSDQFSVLDADLHFEGRRKLKINLKTYIYDDTSKILNRIKMYNSYLDVDNWKIHKTFVSVDSTLVWVEVDEEDYNVISRNNFSLFAGIDKATFHVTWD